MAQPKGVSQNIDTLKSKLDSALHEKNAFTNVLATVEEKTGVKRIYIVYGLALLTGLYLMIGYGSQFLCSFIGFLYPAYCSVKAIESLNKEDDTQWLTYWVVYSAFALLEFFTDIFLFWIPFYWFIKCLFLCYCMVPAPWNGSDTIYTNIIRPFVLKHEEEVDKFLDEAKDKAKDFMNEVTTFASSYREQAEDVASDAAGELVKRNIASSKND